MTLRDVPDAELDAIAGGGFDWLWLLPILQQDVLRNGAWQRIEPEAIAPDDTSFDHWVCHVWQMTAGACSLSSSSI